MITQETLPDLLTALGFTKRGKTYEKTIRSAQLKVDFAKREIAYPEAQGLKVNERQTCNLDANENFVVLECVHRLLEKGYKPEHIELEPKWKLGHGASGGRADILIKDNHGKPLLIIECKTPGREFDSAWRATQRDGDQLFSYAQQIAETQFLCLYASDFASRTPSYTSHVIAHRDNPKYLADNPQFRSFKEATDVKERFGVWRDTYKLDYTTKGIFEDNIQPYHIGKDKYSLADLHVIATVDQQKKYHEFATILRQHNVSGRENAFDKLVNLFLCKLVDEARNPSDLKFYWKGVAYDTHFDLLDRLQLLYHDGMKEFLGEDITYIDRGAVINAMRFIKQNPDATQNAVWNLFLQQKFFTNNDFSFIDVHNERLFYQNADVLLKILQMWQDIKLTGDHQHNQFLGDLFEGFLDQGIKQSEGQFFTPGPICRFIMMSLPLESRLAKAVKPLRTIDYACGAGHFLTELATQMRGLLPPGTDMQPWHKEIHGIEKEYRLSKVAKVSAFMYGQKDINIRYGDALVKLPGIDDGSFDLLVANPPYSVRGFLDTLPEEERNAYALTEVIRNNAETANSIETFFVERAKQLLAAGGIAAIILPASILSNGGGVYVRTREILIQNFDIVAIAEFGSGTFGKTGTNTVTLFLRRKQTTPEAADHYRERVAEWFNGCDASKRKQVIYKDAHLIDAYASHIGVAAADYKTLLKGEPSAALLAHTTFEAYRRVFDISGEVATLKKSKSFKAKTTQRQTEDLAQRFLAFMQNIEQDKLYHFVMASDQSNPVLLIRSPSGNKDEKEFLGYEWSGRKGDEGIKLIRDAKGQHVTKLYDETDRHKADKLNRLIANNFDGILTTVPAVLGEVASVAKLVDLLDFSRPELEKQIVLSAKHVVHPSSASTYPLVELGSVAKYADDAIQVNALTPQSYVGVDNLQQNLGGKVDSSFVPKQGKVVRYISNDILVGNIRPYLKKMWLADSDGGASNDVLILRKTSDDFDSRFLYHWLAQEKFFSHVMAAAKGLKMPRGDKNHVMRYLIPKAPLELQQEIAAACDGVDAETNIAQSALADARQSIDIKVTAIYSSAKKMEQIDNLLLPIIGVKSKIPEDAIRSSGAIPVITQETGRVIAGYCDDIEAISDLPLIIFGDHSCTFKLVDFPFVRGADGTQLIKMDWDKFNPKFAYYALKHLKINNSGKYERHYKYLKVMSIPVIGLKEQQQFVVEVEALEKRVANAEAVIAAASARKQAVLAKYL